MKRLFCSLLLILTPGTALAAEAPAQVGLLSSSLRVIGGLGLVIGLLLVGFAVVKRRGNLLPGARGNRIKVREVRHIGPRKSLVLVEVAGRELLLGVGQERISLLTELEQTPGGFEQALGRQLESKR